VKYNLHDRIFGLDLMRSAAILFVVTSHVLWVFPEAQGSWVSLLRLCGVMGVEIFFVLSGFLIGRILYRIFTSSDFKVSHVSYFLIRRWFRTLPNYYLILLVNIVIVLYLGRKLPDTLGKYFGFLQNFTSGMDIFFTESWSLPIEEVAYVIGPLLFYLLILLLPKRNRAKLFLWVTLVIILFFLGTKIGYNHITGPSSLEYWNIQLKAVVLYRIDAIYYGVLAAWVSLKFETWWRTYTFHSFLIGILLFAGLHWAIAHFSWGAETTPFLINVLYLPVCSICIACSLPFFARLKRVPIWMKTPFTFISLISYSMYLLHYSVVLQLMNYWLPPHPYNPITKVFYALCYLIIVVVLSYLLYRFYEKPMMDLRDRSYFRRKFG